MLSKKLKRPAFEDILECQAAIFEWAESFDTKDWERLSRCVSPTLYIDYRAVMGMSWDSLPVEQFIGMASSPSFLGNPRIKTQHFIGASTWVQKSEHEITGDHQMRVAHQKYRDDDLQEVQYQGHAHGRATTLYRKVDGLWRFAGLVPDIRWSEHDYDKIFQQD